MKTQKTGETAVIKSRTSMHIYQEKKKASRNKILTFLAHDKKLRNPSTKASSMTLFLDHATALALYDSGAFSRPAKDARIILPGNHIPAATKSDLIAFAQEYSLPFPICVSAPSSATVRRQLRLSCSVVKRPELRREFYAFSTMANISTPELALLHVSSDMDMLSLISLISQLCSRFTIVPGTPHGFVPRNPVTSKRRILSFLATIPGAKNTNTLRIATQYAVENARSPKEIKIPLQLSLPRRLRGYELVAPLVNQRIDLPAPGMSRFATREVDFLWDEAKLIGEYNSSEFHGESTLSTDTQRANELIGAGFTPISIIPENIRAIEGMDKLAATIAAHIYPNRTKANLQALYAFILQPDTKTRNDRINLRNDLDKLYSGELWRLPLKARQNAIKANRITRNEQRRKRYQLNSEASNENG